MWSFVLCGLFACQNAEKTNDGTVTGTLTEDADGDGYFSDDDCNDNDASINPGADEICDGIDNNCDGTFDEGVLETFYADSDEDGFGNTNINVQACALPNGYASNGSDCDDTNPNSYPGNVEVCDGIDNDCDDIIDNDLGSVFYADADRDGFGDASVEIFACEPEFGVVQLAGDCDDNNPDISPFAQESCDGIDNDCDGAIDEDLIMLYYRDQDEDGFGNDLDTIEACSSEEGYVLQGGDCDDIESFAHPDMRETCDGIDNDCDGESDEDDAIDTLTYYLDSDSDGFGAGSALSGCTVPSGHVLNNDDCDDSSAFANPAMVEICDGIDNDCDGSNDESAAVDIVTYYLDSDSDGFGAGPALTGCAIPTGYVQNNEDCDDNEMFANPAMVEICDGIDNDCDGSNDESAAVDIVTYYLDSDSDGFGAGSALSGCTVPSGHVLNNDDCDDTSNLIHPAMVEFCDGIDRNCDGLYDEAEAFDRLTYYLDSDGDGFGMGAALTGCTLPTGHVQNNDDCDDNAALSNPAMVEICDGIDNDCDGSTDGSDAVDLETYYLDFDADGFGDASAYIQACDIPTSYVENSDDCDDADGQSYPNAPEICDGTDNDCDGLTNDGCDDCKTLLDNDPSLVDGVYTIDPSGDGGYEVYCDMTVDGGGWTLVANISDAGTDVWSQLMPSQDTGAWENTSTIGSLSFTSDYKGQSYMDVEAGDVLIKQSQTNVLYTSGCWSGQSFQEFISGLSWEGDGSDSNWSDSSGAYLCSFTHFGYADTALRASSHSGSDRILAFKWGERDGVQDSNKDRVMITTAFANGSNHHVDSPTGLGGFTLFQGGEQYEDVNECQGDRPYVCSNGDQNYQIYVR